MSEKRGDLGGRLTSICREGSTADTSLLGEVIAARGNHVPHPAARPGHVTSVAWDDVYVQVEDGLTGGFARVDADVEAIGPFAFRPLQDAPLGGDRRLGELRALLGRRFEPIGNVSFRNQQGVVRSDRERKRDRW